MRIALVRQRYNPYGGAERFIERAMAALREEHQIDVSIVTRDWRGAAEDARSLQCNPFYIGRTWRDWGFARSTCRLLSKQAFDLVQSHERLACCDIFRAGDGVHAQWLANRSRVLGAMARWLQNNSPWHRYTLAAERRLFASSRLRAVICNSRMVAAEITRHFDTPSGKLHVIYSGVDLERFRPRDDLRASLRARLGIPAGAMAFLFVGSGFERKGLSQLLKAFARRNAEGKCKAHLLIVGEDRRAAAWKAEARALGIASRAHFAGPQRDTVPWYAAADCFVLPTLYDPFPNAALEALASGLPVITTLQSGAAELLESDRTGWACDALDVDTLARIMAALDQRRARAMGVQARALAEQFPSSAMTAQLLALYRRLLPAS
jgi:UDP-glucose:(heptosyl)LPS alpha-1,3-glucosyltransferase